MFAHSSLDLTDTSQVLPLKRQLEAKTAPISGYTRTMIKTMTTSLQIPHFGYKVSLVHSYNA